MFVFLNYNNNSGNGTTCAVQLLIDCLGLKYASEKPLVILGPFEHHSNLLPWRELGNVDIEMVHYRQNGSVDLKHLERILREHGDRPVKIGSFSAASNLTGTIADDLGITALLHQHGALSVWDYATGASYLNMNMNPTHSKYAPDAITKDAIMFSGHKLLGAVGTPGVLVVKRKLVSQTNPPSISGGGTVFYVTQDHHRFLSDKIERYEGGTPNVVGIWRLGLTMRCKQQLKLQFAKLQNNTTPSLVDYDIQRAQQIQSRLKQIPNLVVVDAHHSSNKLPVFSFLIKCGPRFLHYNCVSAVLNDVFGVQSRGGCQCAGPYAQRLLGLSGQQNAAVEEWLLHADNELLKPGVTRLSLPTLGTTQEQEDYVVQAIEWVAQHGWKLLHVYRYNHRTKEWRHKPRSGARLSKPERKWLSHYQALQQQQHQNETVADPQLPPSLSQAMDNANKLLQVVLQDQSSISHALKMTHEQEDASSTMRWYVYPKEVVSYIQQGLDQVPGTQDRDNLLGIVRPLAWYPISEEEETTPQVVYDLPVDEKNEKKKPQRDSTNWGQGSMKTPKMGIDPRPSKNTALHSRHSRVLSSKKKKKSRKDQKPDPL